MCARTRKKCSKKSSAGIDEAGKASLPHVRGDRFGWSCVTSIVLEEEVSAHGASLVLADPIDGVTSW